MAPAKSKKTELKVKNDVPKKGRGKGKIVEELEDADMELNDKPVIVNEKKNKRGKKAVQENGDGLTNGDKSASQPKKGKKQETDELDNKPLSYDENESSSDSPANGDKADNGDIGESNGDTEDVQSVSSGKSRKRSTKKDTEKAETKPKASRGKKANKVNENVEKEEKPKANKGRGRKAKVDNDVESDEKVELEEEKPEKATKGRKKGPNKVTKEKTPESEESPEEPMEEDEPVVEESKKKTKRNQGKKTVKDDVEEEAPAPKKRKGNKKEEKVKDESKEENGTDDSVPEPKSKGKRGKKVTEVPETEEEAQDTGETKRRRKPADEKAPVEDKKEVPPKKNKSVTDYESIDFSNSSKNVEGKEWNLKISCWNVDGIRAWLGKGGLDYIKYEKPDILCLQETKCSQEKLPEEIKNLPGYHAYWLCSDKDGYAGVGLYTTKLAMNVQYGLQNEELDNEGRIITAEYEQFYLICTYVPNAGRKLVTLPKRLQWNEEFRKYVKELDKKKPVIICGDMNVAHNEIDLANPKTNKKNAGFTAEERAGMTDLLGDGFVDTFRHFYPDKANAYTFWTYMMNSRAKNVGWRLDYFIVSQRILATICDSVIRSSVYGSDHCPIALLLHLTTADKPKE